MNRKRENIIFIIVVLILLIGVCLLCLWYVRIPHRVNRSLSGIRFQTGNRDTQEEQATIEINGTYYKYIVHFPNVHDYFEGDVVISDIDMTAKEMLWTVFLSDYSVTYDKGGTLAYLNSGPLGYIFEKDNFSEVILEISEEDGNDSVYVFPANDKAEAVEEYSILWERDKNKDNQIITKSEKEFGI